MLYMVTFTINIPPMLAYIPYMDPMGLGSKKNKFNDLQIASGCYAAWFFFRSRRILRYNITDVFGVPSGKLT